MYSVWKYPVPIEDEFSIEMPRGARLLRTDVQPQQLTTGFGSQWAVNQPVLWAVVEVDAPKVKRKFRLVGTGHPTTDVVFANYVDTILLNNAELVFHLFDLGEES